MPVAPGFVHEFQIQAYHNPLGGDRVYGPWSEPFIVDGNKAACSVPADEWAQARRLAPGVTPDRDRLWKSFYQCDDPVEVAFAGAPGGFFNSGFGLLSLTRTDLCRDLFTVTPSSLTWDNPAVRQIWRLLWVLSGGMLFGLFVWQALRLTYDWWIDPQPSVGVREMLPKFLMALALSSVSLFICQFVLTLTADLSCFVAQHTGTTMWTFLGKALIAPIEGGMAWVRGQFADGFSITALLTVIIAYLVGSIATFFLLLFAVFIIYFFVKVLWAMVMRLGLLAIMCAVSPIALAMTASDATSKWPKWWVSCFLGAALQQVVVLLVLYLGTRFAADHLVVDAGVFGQFTHLILTMLISMLILALADKVPDIINPNGKGLFSSFGDAVKMAGQAAVVAATGGAGAIAGMAAGAAQGAGAAAQGAKDAGFSPDGGKQSTGVPGGPPSPDGGGGQSGGPLANLPRSSSNVPGGVAAEQKPAAGSAPVSSARGTAPDGGGGAGGDVEAEEKPAAPKPGSLAADIQSVESAGAVGGAWAGRRLGQHAFGTAGRVAGGVAGGLAGGARGALAGFQRGRAINHRMANIANGSFMTLHRSSGDDASERLQGVENASKESASASRGLMNYIKQLEEKNQGQSGATP